MEVTKLNFKDCLAEISKDIDESCFLSIDCEFTGLWSEQNILPFDTSKEYYEKLLKSTKGFILIQFGLSIFKKDPENENAPVRVKCFNVYTFPQTKLTTFVCQGQSLSFLASNGFDFNKLFSSGVGYCNEAEEKKLRAELAERQEFRKQQIKIRTSEEEQDISGRNFLPVPDNEAELIEDAKQRIQNVLDNKVLETKFEKVNGFQRKLIYELIEREFNNKVSTLTKNGEGYQKILVVTQKRTLEEELKMENDKMRDDENNLTDSIGLRLLMKKISESKKPIVGHNCLLDFFYIISQCFTVLPESYEDFKKLIHSLFPNIMDTKFITNSEKFKELFSSTVLNQVYERLQTKPFAEIKVEFENPYMTYNLKSPKEHEAGFDSFLTGYCFLVLLDYLKVPLAPKFEKSKELSTFLNRIALQRIQTPYIYLTGNEPVPNRSHVFYIKFPQTWQSSDIQDHFKNYGPVQISWVDNVSAFVALYNKENSSCVVKTIAKPPGFEIKSFADFQAVTAKKQQQPHAGDKRKISEPEQSPSPAAIKRKKINTFKECNDW